MGAWHNKDGDGKVYLDLSIVLDDEAEAREMARKHGQLGMFNLSTFETIETMTAEEREQFEAGKSLFKTQVEPIMSKHPNATIVSVPKTREGIIALSIQVFEQIAGRKATPEEIEEVRNMEWENVS